MASNATDYGRTQPDPIWVELLVPDLAGRLKGRRLSADRLESACGGDEKIDPRHLGATMGGPALSCHPVAGPMPVPRSTEDAAQILCAPEDPAWNTRAVLERCAQVARDVESYEARIEVYLFENCEDETDPRPLSTVGQAPGALGALAPVEPIWADLLAASDSQELGLAGIESARGEGRYRLRLAPDTCPMQLADRILLLRRALAGIASGVGSIASFMTVPFTDAIPARMTFRLGFAAGAAAANAASRLSGGPGAALPLHAANANAFRLFSEHPAIPPVADGATLLHGMSGADANPYLALAAILAAIKSPTGDAWTAPASYERALDEFDDSDGMRGLLGESLHRNTLCQRCAEQAELAATIRPLEYLWYLHTV